MNARSKITGALLALTMALPAAALAAPPEHAGGGNPFKNQMDEIQTKMRVLKEQGMGSSTDAQATSTNGKPTLTGIENAMQRIRETLERLNAAGINPPGLTNALNKLQCISLNRNLARGAQGDDVKQLQQRLISEGQLDSESATGFFGPKTEKALQKWQAMRGVVASGTPQSTGFGAVGPRTRALFANCFGNGTTTPPIIGDTTAPSISGLSISAIGTTSASISWFTNELASSKLYFGTSSPLMLSSASSISGATSTMSHSLSLNALMASTTYYVVVESKDAANNTATSSQQSFSTN